MSSTQQLLLGEGAGGAAPVYIEDVFSTYLYTGTGAALTITNNIDLSTKGGLVWIKRRDGVVNHYLATTNGGTSNYLNSNTTSDYETGVTTRITSFNTDGFSLGSAGSVNNSGSTFVGWTFREQPKFFDVVTYTGNGTSGRTVTHNLGSVPGCIIVKRTSGDPIEWAVYHRSLDPTSPQNYYLRLNTTAIRALQSGNWNDTAPTSTVFTLGDSGAVNTNGETYVAYLFAHDAGGFGAAGTDNVISCGSYTGTGSTLTVTLGYEIQWLLVKRATGADANWILMDVMRGLSSTDAVQLSPNTTGADNNAGVQCNPTATGFEITSTGSNLNNSGNTYIYIAIRRGPMKVPTLGTTVFEPATRTGTGANATITSSTYPVDMTWIRQTNGSTGYSFMDFDRLRGALKLLYTNNTQSQNNTSATVTGFDVQNGYYLGDDASGYGTNVSGQPIVYYNFKRAPGFFDEVCYTGTGSARTITHNLAAVPELMIVKSRSRNPSAWYVYNQASGNTKELFLDSTVAVAVNDTWNNTTPTSSVFSLDGSPGVNDNNATYVAYLFATCAGVSKVGSYTGNGATQTINCGFTGGARFVIIKRTDSTGDWYVYDTARGMTLLTDPYLLLNSANAQVATLGSVTTVSTGFALDSTILAAINVSAGTYIFLAIA